MGRRKLRLFACACCRQIWSHLFDPKLKVVVETAEKFADGEGTIRQLQQTAKAADVWKEAIYEEDHPRYREFVILGMIGATADETPFTAATGMTHYPVALAGCRGNKSEANALLCALLRDIFGNPFRPAPFDPAWRTSTAVAIARGMYDSRDFSAMPILADALQDAGCDNDDVLTHCRAENGIHVRGCWVVDLVLGGR